jgi:hypothetical protein
VLGVADGRGVFREVVVGDRHLHQLGPLIVRQPIPDLREFPKIPSSTTARVGMRVGLRFRIRITFGGERVRVPPSALNWGGVDSDCGFCLELPRKFQCYYSKKWKHGSAEPCEVRSYTR